MRAFHCFEKKSFSNLALSCGDGMQFHSPLQAYTRDKILPAVSIFMLLTSYHILWRNYESNHSLCRNTTVSYSPLQVKRAIRYCLPSQSQCY